MIDVKDLLNTSEDELSLKLESLKSQKKDLLRSVTELDDIIWYVTQVLLDKQKARKHEEYIKKYNE